MSFFAELKRRNVFKAGIAYAIVAISIVSLSFVNGIHTPING